MSGGGRRGRGTGRHTICGRAPNLRVAGPRRGPLQPTSGRDVDNCHGETWNNRLFDSPECVTSPTRAAAAASSSGVIGAC